MENDNSKRLMLFFMLTLGFMLVWSRLFPAPPPKKPVQRPTASRNLKQSPSSRPAGQRGATPQAQASSKPTSANSTQPSSRATSLAATSSTHKQDQLKAKPIPEKSLTVERKLLTMKVSNRGGGLTRLSLKRFYNPKSKEKKPLELIHPKLRRQPPFREHFVDKALLAALRPGAQHNKKSISYTSMSQTENAIVLKRTLPLRKGGSILLEKRYVFGKKEYAFSVQYKIKNQSLDSIRPSMRFVLSDYINRQTMNKGGMFSGTPDTFEALCMKKNEKRPVRHAYESLLKGPQKQDGSIDYIAVDRRYFMMAWLPDAKSKGCVLKATPTGYMHLSFQRPQEDLAPGQSTTFEMKAFFGPKYYNRLEQVGGRLDSSVDFGIFAFISKPMLWLMQTFYDGMGKVGMANWGLAIIFLTLLVKLLMWIPTSKQMESMKKMSKLKPQMDKLKEKYGDDKESIQRETMALYSREGVNPLGGCLPMLLQMPIWLALYNTLYYAVELYQAPFIPGWINDLSVRDPIFVLPITLGVLMFLQQKMTPTTGMDGTQAQIMQIFMPVFFTAIMLFLPSGLTLYILVNTLIGIIHQWIVYNQPDKPVDPKKKRKPSWLERMNQYVEEQQKKASS